MNLELAPDAPASARTAPASFGEASREIRGACPLDCPDTCSWIVTVKGAPTAGEAVALRGDPHHPYTRGSLCNKVADYLTYARSPDRLVYPMRRSGAKGSGEFTPLSVGWNCGLRRGAPECCARADWAD